MAASDPTCAVCLVLVTNCRRCPQCQQVFCGSCLSQWLQTPIGNKGCPTCRASMPFREFLVDVQTQHVADQTESSCEYGCGASFPWGERLGHVTCAGRCPCPFMGCDFVGSRKQLDAHVVVCPHSTKYSVEALVQTRLSDAKRAHDADASVAEHITPLTVVDNDSDTLRHILLDSDTLAGLAIRYGTTKQTIRRLNGFTGEAIHGFEFLIVPRPADFVPSPQCAPSAEVLVALRKKKLTRRLCRMTQTSTEEAVAYLSLTDFDVDEALRKFQDDTRWEAKHPKQGASLTEFLRQQAARSEKLECGGCAASLGTGRGHCPSCGAFFCSSCLLAGSCSHQVSKGQLGVTCPTAAHAVLNVCASCHRRVCDQ
eukprot:m.178860 g.178860  ORF g.178860 m.178860 type:complete len:369 (-) comp17986_c1_seq4:52-1158(-)